MLNAHMDTVKPGIGVKPMIDGDIIRSAGETILGTIYLEQAMRSPQDLELLRILANQAALAIENAFLYNKEKNWFEVTLTQGKNRQIRNMFEAVGRPVQKLRRIRIGFLTAEGLPVGHYRHLTAIEVDRVLRLGQKKS